MQAYVIHGPRDLRLVDCDEPPLAADEVRLALAYGGICGSDLHYYREGRVGNSIVRDPMILGHEFSGRVIELGNAVDDLKIGTPVAVNPALPCQECRMCRAARYNLCLAMRYMGSAAFRPHTQGGFREQPVVHRSQCLPLPESTSLQRAALAEPYAIALHAVSRAGVRDARVLITGAGTIGTLTAIAARRAGAAHITVSDVEPAALERVESLAGITALNANNAEAVGSLERAADHDVAIEASGAGPAFNMALQALQPGGSMVQAGFLPTRDLDLNRLITKEITLLGTYRFLDEFEAAVAAVVGDASFDSVITATYPFGEMSQAFQAAADKTAHLKIMLAGID